MRSGLVDVYVALFEHSLRLVNKIAFNQIARKMALKCEPMPLLQLCYVTC